MNHFSMRFILSSLVLNGALSLCASAAEAPYDGYVGLGYGAGKYVSGSETELRQEAHLEFGRISNNFAIDLRYDSGTYHNSIGPFIKVLDRWSPLSWLGVEYGGGFGVQYWGGKGQYAFDPPGSLQTRYLDMMGGVFLRITFNTFIGPHFFAEADGDVGFMRKYRATGTTSGPMDSRIRPRPAIMLGLNFPCEI